MILVAMYIVQHPLDIAFDQIHPAEDLAAGEVAVEVLQVE